jgi:type IV pilus assembly protein PilW
MMHTYHRQTSGTGGRNSRGFSIVELMVAMLISLILLGGIAQIFMSSKKSFTVQNTLGRQQENGRYSIDTLAQDLRRAGYYGGNVDNNPGTTLDFNEIAGTLGKQDEDFTCPTGNTNWGRMLDVRIHGLNDTAAGYACVNDGNGYLRGDVLVLHFMAPWFVGGTTTPGSISDSVYANRVFLRTDMVNARIFKGSEEANAANDLGSSPAEREAELLARAYYIGPSGTAAPSCTGGQAVPSLYRENLNGSGAPEAQEIAYGVENFQVRYGIDADGDDVVDQYLDANDAPLNAAAVADRIDAWNQIIAARIWVLTRAECPETGFTNTATYSMGDVDYAVNDGYRRQLYQSTVRLRNR